MADSKTPNLDRLEEAIAAGEVDRARLLLGDLTSDERELLRIELGAEGFARLFEAARRPRGPKRGRVLVLNGIMGATLHSVKPGGSTDRIWFNIFRIIGGRFTDLETTLEGKPVPGGKPIVAKRLMKRFYIPLVLEIGRRWHVKPFPFDWRLDVDDSAARLAAEIQAFGGGEPVHLVAHSMGGLVCRRFVLKFPDVWKAMDDPDGHQRGGRLIMLGTPNKGSFAVPLIFTGEEKMARLLAKLDFEHGDNTVRRITNKFPGAYQMLPSPLVDLGDDHTKLFQKKNWGSLPIHQKLLDLGRSFQEELDPVIDPDRMVYVAGYDQETPHQIHKVGPGSFTYETTRDGDGRVPHRLGLLEDVTTRWVLEAHGALPKNGAVLDGIHELLGDGDTAELESELPTRRTIDEPIGRQRAAEIEPTPRRAEELIHEASRKRKSEEPLSPEKKVELETLILEQYLGGAADRATRPSARRNKRRRRLSDLKLKVEVVWGDVIRASGDVYCVGHYEGVLPQAAEKALDRVITGAKPGRETLPHEMVLNQLTRRGVLRGQLGDIKFFPWAGARYRRRIVAVAGMGHPGTFTNGRLRQLASDLAWAIGTLPNRRRVCTVLIGAGNGGLKTEDCIENLLTGLADALAAGLSSPIRTLRIVEWDLVKARRIHRGVSAFKKRSGLGFVFDETDVVDGLGGGVGRHNALALALAAAARANDPKSRRRDALKKVLQGIPARGDVKEQVLKELRELPNQLETTKIPDLASKLRVDFNAPGNKDQPSRISFIKEAHSVRVAAITSTAVVAERELGVNFSLIEGLIEQACDPPAAEADELSSDTHRLLIPGDFTDHLELGKPMIFEVDRTMAQVNWELMASQPGNDDPKPFAIEGMVARQLRTSYSPPPAPLVQREPPYKALVVGDPGDPAKGHDLPGARREAELVFELLRSRKDFEVTALIGAPTTRGRGPLHPVPPASLRNVLRELWRGGYDLLHYAGHGDFDPDDPRRVGWLFKGGMLTAAELERVDEPPRLIVANACLSARTSERTRGDVESREALDAGLLPSLADEFFRRGVRNYVGTAWEVSDEGAVLFTETLYDGFLPGGGDYLGKALMQARLTLHEKRNLYGALWAAYQHYGDPLLRWESKKRG